ncbi:hypothetical protein PCYB_146600 [Plasmodium cynomolgi strain B]|uniref:Ribosome-binding factor A n=1 Tax=Plasmodium cynomolgi (strain B) TaxID=1120755 RepID=K6UEZ9_PLACD|nr:hypothetical protein PCYB_146600 [Plasmodium cynomolgi strain B]GAB69231.1 hypothetical protein PCYB_146600 [Plasmodium cynomolgi strain B]
MSLARSTKWAVNFTKWEVSFTKWEVSFTKGKQTPFSTFRGWKKKDKYDDLENKHLYWSINNMKKEFLEGETSDNFFYSIEKDKMEEHISDIVGINSSIPNNKTINESMKKCLPREGRSKGENKQKDDVGNTTKETITEEKYNFPKNDQHKEESIFNYESLKGKGLYQDLTHDEYQRMNDLYIKKCDVDRKIRWFKMSSILNPIKEAKSIVNAQRLSEDEKGRKGKKNGQGEHSVEAEHSIEAEHSVEADESITQVGSTKRMQEFPMEEDIKPYYQEEGNFSQKIKRICEQNQYDEIVSRIRMKIRKEKMENSKIMKEKIPNVARHILDPIKYHVHRRRIRTEKLLHTHLEQLLNCNNAYFRFYLLNGLCISIHHLEMKSTRSLCKIVYTLLNKNIHHDMIKDKLEKVAFILRKLLARKLQLGYTPPLKFVPLQEEQEKKVKNLHYYKLYAKYNYPTLETSNARDRGAQLMDFYGKDLAGF